MGHSKPVRSFNRMIRGSFHNKLLASFLALSFIPIVLIGFLMVKILQDNTKNEEVKQFNAAAKEVDYRFGIIFSGIKDAFSTLQNDPSFYTDKTFASNQAQAYSRLYETTAGYREYADFAVYSINGTCLLSTNELLDLPDYWGILRDAAQAPENVIISAEEENNQSVLRIAKAIRDQNTVTGYMVASMKSSNISYLLAGIVSSQEGIHIVDSSMETVYAAGTADILNVNSEIRSQVIRTGSIPSYLDKYDVYLKKIPDTEFYTIFLKLPLLSNKTLSGMYRLLYLLGSISIALCFAAAWLFSRSFSEPLKQMNTAMKKVQEGDLNVRIKENRKDEFGTLSENFNMMTEELDNFVEQKIETQKKLSDIQIAMMTAQLNPHFLYNTLDTIKWMAKSARAEPIALLSAKLARILRTSIDRQPFISLKEECQLCADYIDIQNIRFNGKFELDFSIPDSLYEYEIPKLILQPIVENSIKHGFEDVEKGIITIKAEETEEEIRLIVSDNGCGMPEEMLKKINKHDWNDRNGHIGLYNVDMILRLNYGTASGLLAMNKETGGTEIEILIPKKKEIENV